jgi:hypothetical protein
MPKREKIATFLFISGNSCDVLVDLEKIHTDLSGVIKIEWDRFPPSPEDCKLWSREYFPEACRRINELMPGGPVRMAAVDGYGRVTRIDPEKPSVN